MEKDNKEVVSCGAKDEDEEEKVDGDVVVECSHCSNHPCILGEIEPLLISILETYREWKYNKQVRFKMYAEATTHIHGPGLGKGVRKKLPHCVTSAIRSMAPADDKKYTGFIPRNNDNDNYKS